MTASSLISRRICAVVLLIVVFSGLTLTIRLVFSTYGAQQQMALESIQARTNQSLSVIAKKSTVEAESAAFDRMIDELGLTVSSPSLQQGFAAIQTRIDDIVAGGGGTIERIETGDPRGDNDRSILPVSFTFKAEATQALEILAELENGAPRLFARNLSLRAVQLPDARLAGKTQLTVEGEFDALLLRVGG